MSEKLTPPAYLLNGGLSREEILARVMDPEALAAENAQRERESRLMIRYRCVDPDYPPTFSQLSWRWAK